MGELAKRVAEDAGAVRLAQDLSRRTLALRSRVSEASIQRFESSGLIAFESLVLLADALGSAYRLQSLFTTRHSTSLDEIRRGVRQRGV